MKMENRYQSRLRRNQANIVKEIAVKVQEGNQDIVREIAQEMKTTDHLISQVIKKVVQSKVSKDVAVK